jgi:hypothetical protein
LLLIALLPCGKKRWGSFLFFKAFGSFLNLN